MRLLVLLVATALAGCTQSEEAAWHGREVDESWQVLEIPARGQVELDFQRMAGEELIWDWFADEQVPLRFDVHAHIGGEHRYLVQNYVPQNMSSVQVDEDGMYSMMWRNHHPDAVRLWMDVPQDHVVRSYG